jgi:hypothetical protein
MKTRSQDFFEGIVSDPGTRRARKDGWHAFGGASHRIVLTPLLRHDPVNINYGDGPEVYVPESETIVARLGVCEDAEQVCRVVHEELCGSFGSGAVGSRRRCAQIAREIWELWDHPGAKAIGNEDARSSCFGVVRDGRQPLFWEPTFEMGDWG